MVLSCGRIKEKFNRNNKSAEDIDLEKVKTPCDCVKFANIIYKDIFKYSRNKTDAELQSDTTFAAKQKKYESLKDKCEPMKKEMAKCSDVDKFQSNMNKYNKRFKKLDGQMGTKDIKNDNKIEVNGKTISVNPNDYIKK